MRIYNAKQKLYLGEIYAGKRIQVLEEGDDREDYLPVKYQKDVLECESLKVWVNSNQDYLEIDVDARSFNIVIELDARYEPSADSKRMGYVKNNERLYVRKIEGNYAGNGYNIAWFTNTYIKTFVDN